MNDYKFKIEKAHERQKLAWESLSYSDRRIDLLLISISGGGIYVCLETIRYLSDKSTSPHWLIWASSISFLTAIILNFIGQFISKKSNQYDFLMCDSEKDFCVEPDNIKHAEDAEKYDNLSAKFNRFVDPINYICTSFMVLGLGFILSYFLLVF